MVVKKIFLYIIYQYKNQFRKMSLKSKIFFALDYLDAFINPIFFSAIFFILNPSDSIIIFASIVPYFFNIVNRLESTKNIILKDNYAKSFQLVGMTKREYILGLDNINALPAIISNLSFSLFILFITFHQYSNIFIINLGYQVVFIVLLPIFILVRSLLVGINQKVLVILSKVCSYQVFVLILAISRIGKININQFGIAILLYCLFIILMISQMIKIITSRKRRNKGSLLITELKIALQESNFSISSLLFLVVIWVFLASYLMLEFRKSFSRPQYNNSFTIIGLAYTYIPLIILSFIHTGLAYCYGYDLEGLRMRTERYLGDFISHKIKYKLRISYLLSLIPYGAFGIVFILFLKLTEVERMKYFLAYSLGLALQPMTFFVGTLLFPNYHRSMFDFEQRMSNASLIFGFIFSSIIALGSSYYVWESESAISTYILLPIVIDIAIFVICKVIVKKKKIELKR